MLYKRDTFPVKISIVTVTYNCKDTVEKTIRNVLKQTYKNIEYIVIDGASTDGTCEIINRYADRLVYLVSEPDRGIYDAMNKGIKAATGEWIFFLNSGDYFLESTTIEKVFEWYKDKGEAFIAGGIRKYTKFGYRDVLVRDSDKDVWECPVFQHQGTFIRTAVQKKNPYPIDLKISADYYFFQKMMLNKEPFVVYNGLIALFEGENGVSTNPKYTIALLKERILVQKRLGAPTYKIKNSIKALRREPFRQRLLSIAKLFPCIYNPYHKKQLAKRYTQQSLEETLRNV